MWSRNSHNIIVQVTFYLHQVHSQPKALLHTLCHAITLVKLTNIISIADSLKTVLCNAPEAQVLCQLLTVNAEWIACKSSWPKRTHIDTWVQLFEAFQVGQ